MSRKLVDDDLAGDLLWGVGGKDGIAAFLGIKERKAYHLIKCGALPVSKHSHRTITARRSELRRHFSTLQSESPIIRSRAE